jgi:hypothetical protein
MNKPINLVLMGLYVVLLIVGLIFSMSTLIYLSTVVAIFTFLLVQNQERNKTPDEREKLIVERASSISFQMLLGLLIVLSVAVDFINVLDFVSLSGFVNVLMGLGFMTFVSMYDYYQTKF